MGSRKREGEMFPVDRNLSIKTGGGRSHLAELCLPSIVQKRFYPKAVPRVVQVCEHGMHKEEGQWPLRMDFISFVITRHGYEREHG